MVVVVVVVVVVVAHESHAGLRDWIVRLFVGEILGPPTRWGGGVLLYISYIGVCHPKERYKLIGKLRVMVPV